VIDRNQVLERMTVIRAARAGGAAPGDAGAADNVADDSEATLEALYQAGGTGDAAHGIPVALAGPHPWMGGSMDSPILAELVWQLGRRRHPTLRFNWRGVGASTGATGTPAKEDLAAAVAQLLASTGAPTCALVGVSLGCAPAAALATAHDGVERLVLISPPITGDHAIAIDWAALAQSGTPTLVIVGDADPHAPVAELRSQAGAGAVRVVAGASHTYLRGLTELGRLVLDAIPAPGGLD
jgi:alpha/beta superfamily hydrolase